MIPVAILFSAQPSAFSLTCPTWHIFEILNHQTTNDKQPYLNWLWLFGQPPGRHVMSLLFTWRENWAEKMGCHRALTRRSRKRSFETNHVAFLDGHTHSGSPMSAQWQLGTPLQKRRLYDFCKIIHVRLPSWVPRFSPVLWARRPSHMSRMSRRMSCHIPAFSTQVSCTRSTWRRWRSTCLPWRNQTVESHGMSWVNLFNLFPRR